MLNAMNEPMDDNRVANESTIEEKVQPVIPEIETNQEVTEDVIVSEESPDETVQSVNEPVDEVDEPVDEVDEPVDEMDEPVDEVDEPVSEVDEPVDEVDEPVDEVDEPVNDALMAPDHPIVEKEEDKLTKEQIIQQVSILLEKEVTDSVKAEVDALKQAFYKLKKQEAEELKKSSLASESHDEKEVEIEEVPDDLEEQLKKYLLIIKEKRAVILAETEKVKFQNLATKRAIIEELKVLIDSQDDFHKVYNEFRSLQQKWKEIKNIPQTHVNDLWKEYQHYSEKFYDLIKINNEMRDYDFKKNLELKTTLCEAVEKLDEEQDVISAFYQLQKFHQEWREIGPVAKDLREEVWSRFKKASTVINKRHQDHFESLRSMEQRNLEEKMAICKEMETIDYSKLLNFRHWYEQNRKVLDLQEKWKTIGFAPKKSNIKAFERFRTACDSFFQKKSDYYKTIKESMDTNMEKKKQLCEKAEALKDSQEWKETTDKLIALQKEWKTIGAVSRKHSDVIWKRFVTACDYFFEQKNLHFSSQKNEEIENLKAKKAIIASINAMDESLSASDAIIKIREWMSEWNSVGFVPFREKDKIYKEYRNAVDKHFDRLKIDVSERRLQSFKSNLSELTGRGDKSKGRMLNERDKLMRTYERLKNDIQTYENNIGFLSVSSKGGGGLVKEMSRKIESLKEELELILRKIEVIDENLQ